MARASTATQDNDAQQTGQQLVLHEARMPYHLEFKDQFAVDVSGWKFIVDNLFRSAQTMDAVVMALQYCKSRNLDIFKRPVHIVPMWDTKKGGYVETVWPSISELRTTATRTKEYAGIDEAVFGPMIRRTFKGKVWRDRKQVDHEVTVEFPEWCRIDVYRFVGGAGVRKFAGPKVRWLETYATQGKEELPNTMWQERPEGQIEKCAEAAALRRAFPEELGNEYAAEEMEGRRLITTDDQANDGTRPAGAAVATVADRDSAPPKRQTVQQKAQQQAPQDQVEDGNFTEVDDSADDPDEEAAAFVVDKTDMSFEQYASAYIKAVQDNAKTPKHVYEFADLNKKGLDILFKKAKGQADRVRREVEKILVELRKATQPPVNDSGPIQTSKKDDPISSGPQQQDDAPPKRTAKPAQIAGPVTDPEELLKQIKDTLALVNDPNDLEEAWETCQQWVDQLSFPMDKDAALGLHRDAEKRLGG